MAVHQCTCPPVENKEKMVKYLIIWKEDSNLLIGEIFAP